MCSNVYLAPFDGILTSSPQPGATIQENPFVHFSRALEFLWQQQLWVWQQQVSRSKYHKQECFYVTIHLTCCESLTWSEEFCFLSAVSLCQFFHVAKHMMPHLTWYLSPSGMKLFEMQNFQNDCFSFCLNFAKYPHQSRVLDKRFPREKWELFV